MNFDDNLGRVDADQRTLGVSVGEFCDLSNFEFWSRFLKNKKLHNKIHVIE